MRFRMLVPFVVGCLLVSLAGPSPSRAVSPEKNFRWKGHPFVFVFTTDDGTSCNLGWAELARQKDFRFTIGYNSWAKYYPSGKRLSPEQAQMLHDEGFEIANHTYSHCQTGVPVECPMPPRGSLLAYFDCEGFAPGEADRLLHVEISRDSVATICRMPFEDVRTLLYPRHRHSKAIIDSLVAAGYIGARYGDNTSYLGFSNEDFDVPARNAWNGGISLFRIPLAAYTGSLVGNHSADPPVHFTYEEFVAATQPLIDQAVVDGGMFVLYAHHYGDDDDTFGTFHYGSGGLTAEELGWIVDLVRLNGGAVMTLAEAVEYYRSRSVLVDMDGDYVWSAQAAPVAMPPARLEIEVAAHPNPFNAATEIDFEIPVAGPVDVCVYDLHGNCVAHLAREEMDPGPHRVWWNGRDDAGLVVASGVYGVTVECPAGRAAGRLTLLK